METQTKLLDFKAIESEYGLAKSTTTKMLMRGQFITPVKIGRKNYFKRTELEEWIDKQQSA